MYERRSRANFTVVSNFHIPEHARIRSDDDAFTKLWMTISSNFTSSSQGDAVKKGAIVIYDSRLADDDAVTVVNHDASSESSRGM